MTNNEIQLRKAFNDLKKYVINNYFFKYLSNIKKERENFIPIKDEVFSEYKFYRHCNKKSIYYMKDLNLFLIEGNSLINMFDLLNTIIGSKQELPLLINFEADKDLVSLINDFYYNFTFYIKNDAMFYLLCKEVSFYYLKVEKELENDEQKTVYDNFTENEVCVIANNEFCIKFEILDFTVKIDFNNKIIKFYKYDLKNVLSKENILFNKLNQKYFLLYFPKIEYYFMIDKNNEQHIVFANALIQNFKKTINKMNISKKERKKYLEHCNKIERIINNE